VGRQAKPGRPDDDDRKRTIIYDSTVGKRLAGMRTRGTMFIVFQGRRIPIASRITIGRDPANSISLDDMLVSRFHAVVQKVKDDYFIEDLGSTNGTFVNGERIPAEKYVRLQPADTVLIGRSELSLLHFA
jgi:pSer/pThr/pTyr-binding forkhead associated (FHA) protein